MTAKKKKDSKEETAVVKSEQQAMASRFISKVTEEMAASIGAGVKFSESQKRLATNLFVKVDNDLTNLEGDRLKNNKGGTPIAWKNVNMQKLALDAAHRIQLGLDALVPNHLHTIPYFNKRTSKYDVDLRIGYKGKHLYRVKFCSDDLVDIRYELVYSNDAFKVLKRDVNRDVETYIFEPAEDAFDRGEVVGGFGYIIYKNPSMNKVVTVSKKDFDAIKNSRVSGPVWKSDHEERMQWKTVVHRTTEMLNIDTTKTNMSYHYVEAQDDPYLDELDPSKAIEQPTERESIDFDPDTGVIEDAPGDTPETEEVPDEVDEENPFNYETKQS